MIDADSGELATSIPIVSQEMDSMPLEFLQLENSSDQPVLVRYSIGTTVFVYLLDLQTGTVRKVTMMDTSLSGGNHCVDCAALDTAGNVILMRGDGSGIYNGNYGTFQVTSPDRADLICYDARTLKIKWQSEITNYIYSSSRTIQTIPGSTHLLIQSGDVLQVHDSLTGKKLSQCQLPAIPLHLTVEAEEVWGITQNGAYFRYDYADNQCLVMPFTDSTLDGAIVNQGYFVHVPLENQVTVYRSTRDAQGTTYTGKVSSVLRACRTRDDHILGWTGSVLYLFDTNRKTLLWQQEPGYGWELLDFSKDGTRLWMVNKSKACVAEFSVQDGAMTEIPIALDIEDRFSVLESDFFFAEDALMYILKQDGRMQLQHVDLNTGKRALVLELEELKQDTINYSANSSFILASDTYVWILHNENVYVIDLDPGKIQQILSGISSKPAYTRDASHGELIVAAGSSLLLATPDGRITSRIELGDKKGVSVYYCNSQILILCDDGAVYRYDRQGNLLSKTPLDLYDTFFSKISGSIEDPMDICWWQTDDGDLILKAFNAGNIIDCSHWQSRAFVPYLYAYIPSRDEIVCFAEYQFHAYPRYTTQQQMLRAQDALGDFRLSEEQLKFYGLN